MPLTKDEKKVFRKINSLHFSYGGYMEFMKRDVPLCVVCKKFMYARFVVPDETRWECQKCGACCTGLGGKIDVKTVPGLEFTEDGACTRFDKATGTCLIQDTKPAGCLMWPFHGAQDTNMGPQIYLVVNSACPGFGKGPIITDEIYEKLLGCIKTGKQVQDAFREG